jgi:hypothetical protein
MGTHRHTMGTHRHTMGTKRHKQAHTWTPRMPKMSRIMTSVAMVEAIIGILLRRSTTY